ncbi:MAG: hypothetical protein GC153_00915 [Alphaproteobacteria bacterium]|nr:hypothetical protein [Alphaproteobacteria bacterium]
MVRVLGGRRAAASFGAAPDAAAPRRRDGGLRRANRRVRAGRARARLRQSGDRRHRPDFSGVGGLSCAGRARGGRLLRPRGRCATSRRETRGPPRL